MEQGFVLDNTYGARVVSQWAAGAPLKSFWVGTKLPDEKLVPIGTYRCSSCGSSSCMHGRSSPRNRGGTLLQPTRGLSQRC